MIYPNGAPCFALEISALFWGVDLTNRGHWGSRYMYLYINIFVFFNLFTYQLVDFFQFLTNTFGQAVEDRFALETPEFTGRFFLEVPTDWVYWLNTWKLHTYTSKGVVDYECLLRSEKPLGRETQLGGGGPAFSQKVARMSFFQSQRVEK